MAALTELQTGFASACAYVVRRRRLAKGWSQVRLAFHACLSPSEIQHIERGRRNPRVDTLLWIADAFGICLIELIAEICRVQRERQRGAFAAWAAH